jgi:hypothetical protein
MQLNLESGKFGYRTHNFIVKPSAVQELGQVIEIKNDEPEYLCRFTKDSKAPEIILEI